MNNCVFCKIVKGEVPSYKVYEDEHFLAFLDINPRSPGHVQLIPKQHYRWVWDVPNIEEYFRVARKIVEAIKKTFHTDFVVLQIMGEEVEHAHMWIFQGDKENGELKNFEAHAASIRTSLRSISTFPL